MNTTNRTNNDGQPGATEPRLTKLNQRFVYIEDSDLEVELRVEFAAARKAGRDLDVVFTGEPI